MTSSIDTIVSVTINRETATPSVRGFATPLLVGFHNHYIDRVRSYSSPDEMITDGFLTTSQLYRDAVALCSQTPHPATFMVGRRANGITQALELVPTILTVGHVYSIRWNGVLYSYTVVTSDTVALIIAGIMTAATGISGATLLNGTTKLTITSGVAGKANQLEISAGLSLTDVTADAGIAADLDAIYAANRGWYAFTIDSNTETEITAAAAWAQTKIVLFGACPTDTGVANPAVTTDIASDLVAASRSRVFSLWRRFVGTGAMAAWIGRCIPVNPGRINWAFKNLPGQTVDSLTTNEEAALATKRVSYYQQKNGLGITYDGATPKANEYVDLIVSTDWVHARVQEAVFGLFTSNDIVPYTEAGIELVKSTVVTTLLRAASTNYPILDPISIVVEVPKLDETTTADRAARTLPNVRFRARFQGALNKVVIVGSVYL